MLRGRLSDIQRVVNSLNSAIYQAAALGNGSTQHADTLYIYTTVNNIGERRKPKQDILPLTDIRVRNKHYRELK